MDEKTRRLAKVLKLPRLSQLGIVVNDINKTVKYLSGTFGIGPWFRAGLSDTEHYLGGKKKINYETDLVLAFTGKIQIELIEQKEGDRNVYVDHLEKKGEGIHHLGFFVSDIDKRLEAVDKMGIDILQSGTIKSVGKGGGSVTKYAYLDTEEIGGIIIEYIQTKFIGVNIKMSRFWLELGNITGDVEKMKT
jgi:catechol 2,3-dioxygenase-like lactoylglutathione lyase family enzyme